MDQPPPRLDTARTALFLDLDGTLADIVAEPRLVGPDADRSRVLQGLVMAMNRRVAVLTGRSLADVDRILEGLVVPVAAVHGLDRRMPDGNRVTFLPSHRLPEAKQILKALVDTEEGLMLEDKGSSIAVHYRQAPSSRVARPAGDHAAGRVARPDPAGGRHGVRAAHHRPE